MRKYLDEIIANKKHEVERLIREVKCHPENSLNSILKEGREKSSRFSAALKKAHLSVIAEVKRRSPSLGELNSIANPAELAFQYCFGGAAAISVLTDQTYFGGSLDDLKMVAERLGIAYPKAATLRKDFIVHPLQLAQAVEVGADAVLLITRVLQKELKRFIELATYLGLEALVEIDDISQTDIAFKAGANIIGVNNRNLQTFQVDVSFSERIRPYLANVDITVAASGLTTAADARRMREAGYDAILVGEALVRSANPANLIYEMIGKTL